MQQDVQRVLSRALVDDQFLNQMKTDPAAALRDFDLTDNERAVLTNPDRDLIELMRLGGSSTQPGFNIDITVIIDLTIDLSLDLTLDFSDVTLEAQLGKQRAQIDALADAALKARSGADRLESLQRLLESVSGATRLAARETGQGGGA